MSAVNEPVVVCKDCHPQTDGKMKDYQCDLRHDIKDSKSAAVVKHNKYDDCTDIKKESEKCYKYIKSGFDKYKELSLEAGTTLAQDTEELYKTICKCKDEVKVSLDAKLATSVKTLKKLCDAVKCVNDAYLKLEGEIADNCNAQQLGILQTEIKGYCDRCPPNETGEYNPFNHWIDCICKDVKGAFTDANKLIDISVAVSGVNALVDYSNLKEVAEKLKNEAKELEDDINANLEFTGKETAEACDNLTEAIDELSTKAYEERKANLKKKALYKVCGFVTEDECVAKDKDGNPLTWDDIRNNINSLLCKNTGDPKPPPEPRPPKPDKKSKTDKKAA